MSTHAESLLISAWNTVEEVQPTQGWCIRGTWLWERHREWLASDSTQPLLLWCWSQCLWRCSFLTLQGCWHDLPLPPSYPSHCQEGRRIDQRSKANQRDSIISTQHLTPLHTKNFLEVAYLHRTPYHICFINVKKKKSDVLNYSPSSNLMFQRDGHTQLSAMDIEVVSCCSWGSALGNQTAWRQVQPLPLANWMTLGKFLIFPCLSFLIYIMWITAMPTSELVGKIRVNTHQTLGTQAQ